MIVAGWQRRMPQVVVDTLNAHRAKLGKEPLERWWVMTIYETKREAETANVGDGYASKELNDVRPLYAKEEGDGHRD